MAELHSDKDRPRVIVHVTASRSFGGPERQMVELARETSDWYRTIFVSFQEGGACQPFLEIARGAGFEAVALKRDTPRLAGACRELTRLLCDRRADVVCCHGYKAGLVGRLAGRRLRLPVFAISRGWTGENVKVRLYETLDRWNMRHMDQVVCVSHAQAEKVCRAGVRAERIRVIPNAIRADRFAQADSSFRSRMEGWFPEVPERIVGAAGRLSPEKGFDVLIDAAAEVVRNNRSTGFVIFGEGARRWPLQTQIVERHLERNVILAGFHADLDGFMPHFDLFVLPSYTEGMPNVILEAFAAKVPVVATHVGGTPELVEEGVSGYLVPPGDRNRLSEGILSVLSSDEKRRRMGEAGYSQVMGNFTFKEQALHYQQMFESFSSQRQSTRQCVTEAVRSSERVCTVASR